MWQQWIQGCMTSRWSLAGVGAEGVNTITFFIIQEQLTHSSHTRLESHVAEGIRGPQQQNVANINPHRQIPLMLTGSYSNLEESLSYSLRRNMHTSGIQEVIV